MTSLIANLSTGKGTWIEVMELINSEDWDKIYLITNEFGREKFKPEKPIVTIVIDQDMPVAEIVEQLKSALKGEISDFEVALNLTSGSGKEHMAIISAILKLGLAIRYVTVEDGKLVEV